MKGIYTDSSDYAVLYCFRRTPDPDGLSFHVAPPPPGPLRKYESMEYAYKFVDGEYVEQ